MIIRGATILRTSEIFCTNKCNLQWQVFFLDNIDLGIFNLKHDVLPRISKFDQDKLRRMIIMATDIRKTPTSYSGAPVSYKWSINIGAQYFNFSDGLNLVQIRDPSTVCYTRCTFSKGDVGRELNFASPVAPLATPASKSIVVECRDEQQVTPATSGTNVHARSVARRVSASDFKRNLRQRHPHLVS